MLLRRAAFALLLCLVALGSAEVMVRVDDWIRLGTPLLHTPDNERDLRVQDSLGVRGRPYGRHKQWRLNNFGFRGPDMTAAPAPGCTRVMVLGASETMGFTESTGKEYPAQLRDSLRARGCFEVVNAGMPGASVRGIIAIWENHASKFGSQVVVIYPTPVFYLGEKPPDWPPKTSKPLPPLPFRSRLIEHARDRFSPPHFIQRRRVERALAAETAGKPPEWFFRTPPQDRLERFMTDLDSLVRSVQARGAVPVLVTHANRFTWPPHPDDELLLLAWRRWLPRATPETMLSFEREAAEAMRRYGAARGVTVVDAHGALTGKRALFGDAIHFTDRGAGLLAGLIARQIPEARESALVAADSARGRTAAGLAASAPPARRR